MLPDVQLIRDQFPSLHKRDSGRPRIYFDNPGGTQVPQHVIDRTVDYFEDTNANTHGYFATSFQSDTLIDAAHAGMAALLNASSPVEIIFGQNMTSLTFSMSRSIGRTLVPGDEIILTRMDHDANISPWLWLAQDLGLTVKWLDFDPDTYRYDLDSLDAILGPLTRLAAINYASNALGTINDVRRIGERVREAGGLVYVDAVQYVPHAPTDVQALGCDFLLCSAYKFFGPHQGILWGRQELLESLFPYKVRPADEALPVRFETGALSHEGLAGTLGAIEYLEWVGSLAHPGEVDRRGLLVAAMESIAAYEIPLCRRLIDGIQSIGGLTIHGLTDPSDLGERVPTVSFVSDRHSPEHIARALGEENIFSYDGDYYAQEVIQRLGLADSGGMLRVGLAHYNTEEEVDTFIRTLHGIQSSR